MEDNCFEIPEVAQYHHARKCAVSTQHAEDCVTADCLWYVLETTVQVHCQRNVRSFLFIISTIEFQQPGTNESFQEPPDLTLHPADRRPNIENNQKVTVDC
jgi:hypothetical protein